MAIAAVPGSGKTFTLEILVADLILERGIPPHRIGVFTYMRSSRANLVHRINQRLRNQGKLVRFSNAFTLHSLALRILRSFESRLNQTEIQILEHYEQARLLQRLTQTWLRYHTDRWEPLLPQTDQPFKNRTNRTRFSRSFRSMCESVIRTAKNYRLDPTEISPDPNGFLSWALGIYHDYQAELNRQAKLDYDDLGWRAVELMRHDPEILSQVQDWYDFLFEDEAQDSSPLQDELLHLISGRTGNLVRVGDPNQNIMSTFTTAEPRFFRDFCQQSSILINLDESSRSAPKILTLANQLVDWACAKHPIPELQQALVPQHIYSATAGPRNPTNHEADIQFHRIPGPPEAELKAVVQMALASLHTYPDHSIVILVPTNDLGAKALDLLQASECSQVIDLLRSNPTQQRVINRIGIVITYLAQPTSNQRLAQLVETLTDWAEISPIHMRERIKPWLLQIEPEALLFPGFIGSPALPPDLPILDQQALTQLLKTIAIWIQASYSPWIDGLNLVVQTLYRTPDDLFVCHYLLNQLQQVLGDHPGADWQHIADEIQVIKDSSLNNFPSEVFGFSAEPGSITVTTMHRSKGLEWDHVFLTNLSAYEYPVFPKDHPLGLAFLEGTDLQAEAIAELRQFAESSTPSGSATEQAFLDLAAERLRLLYVGLTRAKRRLTLSVASQNSFERDQPPSLLFGVLQQRMLDQNPV